MYAKVAVENTAFSFDTLFTYEVPSSLAVEKGMRVTVPFGRGNQTRVAMVMDCAEKAEGNNIKTLSSVLDVEPLLSDEMIALVMWIRDRYFCTYYDAVKLMIPTGIGYKIEFAFQINKNFSSDNMDLSEIQLQILSILDNSKKSLKENILKQIFADINITKDLKYLRAIGAIVRTDVTKRNIGDASSKMIRITEKEPVKLTPKQQSVYETLMSIGSVSVKELIYFTGTTNAIIKALVEKGLAEFFQEEVYRKPKFLSTNLEKEKSLILSPEQGEIFNKLVDEYEKKEGISLLYGVTGSGKTSVFLKFIDYVIGTGKEVILMVPEISLTPQTINIFRESFGDNIAVFHSGLSIGERLDEWKRTARGEVKLAIGTRSAVFAPFRNLGLIVMDEEQEHTYKSETTPRYHARDVAKFRASYNKGFCLLSSATPSVESYYMAKTNKYTLHTLHSRFGSATLPSVRLINMNEEVEFGNTSDISLPLKKALNGNFAEGKQSIIMINRRGYNSVMKCSSCNEIITCPNCSISLTYHSANNRLMCHYCGHSREFAPVCPKCGDDKVSVLGFGTQKIEESIGRYVPGARVLRIDADSTSSKYSLEKKLDAFAKGDYDIMIGTQMVAKGLNFENVTLVGVLSADQSLYNDDFRSSERTFDLITQVVGRAGRGKYQGTAMVQTFVPENPYLKMATEQDYFAFYDMEIVYRQAMLYPPFVDIVVVGFVGTDETKVKKSGEHFLRQVSEVANKKYSNLPLRILRPVPMDIAKVNNKYRYRIIIKCKNSKDFREMLRGVVVNFSKNKDFSQVTSYVDLNPYIIS